MTKEYKIALSFKTKHTLSSMPFVLDEIMRHIIRSGLDEHLIKKGYKLTIGEVILDEVKESPNE